MATQSLVRALQRHFTTVIVLMSLLAALIYYAYRPGLQSCSDPSDCSEICLEMLKKEDVEPVKEPTLPKALKTEPDTTVLIWFWPFGQKFDLIPCSEMYNIQGCHLTDDRTLFSKADGVIIHHRDIAPDLSNLPQLPRPTHQKWIWWNDESPSFTSKNPALSSLFNLTTSYRQDSDIFMPYGKLINQPSANFKIPKKDKVVCWIISHWDRNLKRHRYYEELKEHINISMFGTSVGKPVDSESFPKIMSSCKFYLSFENSIHVDYVTEKLFNPLLFGTVPVVLGPPRENYEEHVPGDSFIHVDDFPSLKELADKLRLLDKNPALYEQYFNWHKSYQIQVGSPLESACHTCLLLRMQRTYKVIKNLNKWFWG
ncbi:alpha-(1,3)-fucosyltransferase 9-like [Denticeps clupeoides]|uniref:Fucosyltransferase n=1 Tax=Denticeps clupeoides TaxID=299321 RepID=A0AAY4C3N0_9TELE|nr:alpha-(1,3)-fucosyltransferase 9-like [Denticeps clupeoides]